MDRGREGVSGWGEPCLSCHYRTCPIFAPGSPLGIGAKVMQHGRRQNDVGRLLAEGDLANVALKGPNRAGRSRANPLQRTVEHRLAEVQERHIELRKTLEQFQREMAPAAAEVDHVAGVRRGGRPRLGNPLQRQRCVDRGHLPGFQIGERSTSSSKRRRISSADALAESGSTVGLSPIPSHEDCH